MAANFYSVRSGNCNINWVYKIESITKQDAVALRAVNAYTIYLSVNGDDDMAMIQTDGI